MLEQLLVAMLANAAMTTVEGPMSVREQFYWIGWDLYEALRAHMNTRKP